MESDDRAYPPPEAIGRYSYQQAKVITAMVEFPDREGSAPVITLQRGSYGRAPEENSRTCHVRITEDGLDLKQLDAEQNHILADFLSKFDELEYLRPNESSEHHTQDCQAELQGIWQEQFEGSENWEGDDVPEYRGLLYKGLCPSILSDC